MYPKTVGWLPAIAFIPFAGALLNATLGPRLGKGFVRSVGVLAPLLSFVLALACFAAARVDDAAVVVRGDPRAISQVREYLVQRAEVPDAQIVDEERALRLRGFSLDDPRVVTLQTLANVEVATGDKYPRSYQADLGRWLGFGDFEVRFRFVVDRLAMIMLLVITGVGTLIHLYSAGYMSHEDKGGFARYFTYLNLFVGAMLILVMGGDLLVLFIGWEGVGLCSYLLIGFEYKNRDYAACGSKAFIVNRIGDLGFVLGLLCLLVAARDAIPGATFGADMATLSELARVGALDPTLVGVACLLLFFGATGKSAQIPLHLWLPDAMAGPTPVSALIHAATMVTAGVYMIARLSPVFVGAQVGGVPVLGIVAVVGVLTAFFAGAAALGQDDIKKVLAYSTVSQLGYMFVGVGAGVMSAAVFHLVTHAFFKALLFLAAGSVIHGTGTQSMRAMGGLWRSMPVTFVTMTIGALCLAALPFTSGFFSKDMILLGVEARAKAEGSLGGAWTAIYALGLVTGGMTALYSVRLVCLTFLGEYRGKAHPHESPSTMTIPLVVLAGLSLLGGLLGLPEVMVAAGGPLPRFLEPVVLELHAVRDLGLTVDAFHALEVQGLVWGGLVALAMAGLGYWLWARPVTEITWETAEPGSWQARLRGVLANAWHYDALVNKQGVQPAVKHFSTVLWRWVDDEALDRGLVDGTGRVGRELSLFTRAFQTGRLSRYAGYLVAGAIGLPIVALAGLPLYRELLRLLAGSPGH